MTDDHDAQRCQHGHIGWLGLVNGTTWTFTFLKEQADAWKSTRTVVLDLFTRRIV